MKEMKEDKKEMMKQKWNNNDVKLEKERSGLWNNNFEDKNDSWGKIIPYRWEMSK